MAYNIELDKNLFSESVEVGETTLRVEVYQYNGNQSKIQISRMTDNNHQKLGRLTVKEMEAILPLLAKAVDFINKVEGGDDSPYQVKTTEEITEVKKEEPVVEKEVEEQPKYNADDVEKALEEVDKEEEVKETPEPKKEEIRTLPKFKITFAEPAYLKDVLFVLKNLHTEINFKVGKDGMSCVLMDPANVELSVFKLLSSVCTEWDVPKPFEMCLNTDGFYKVLSQCKKNDMLSLRNGEGYKLYIDIRGKTKSTTDLPLIEYEEREQKIPDLTFNAKVIMDSKTLQDEIKGAGNVASSVLFTVDKKCFNISASGDLSKYNVDNKEEMEIKIKTPQTVKYSIEYLTAITKASKLCDMVTLEFGNDYPLSATYRLVDTLEMRFILAPRVDES